MLVWEGGLIKAELCRAEKKSCHQGPINQIMLDEGEVITAGSDGWVRVSAFGHLDSSTTDPCRSPYWLYQIFISHKVHFMKEIEPINDSQGQLTLIMLLLW